MTARDCQRVAPLVDDRRAALTEADRLRLEEHLAGCDECASAVRLIDGIVAADRAVWDGRPSRAAGRALDRALAAAGDPRGKASVVPAGAAIRRRAAIAAAAAVAVAAGIVLWWGSRDASPARVGAAARSALPETAREPETPVPPTAPGDHVERGAVTVDDRALAPGDAIASGPVIAVRPATLVLAHAHVDVQAGTEIAWAPVERELRLVRGSVQVAVDPGPRRLMRVATDQFVVEVLGTTFAVDAHSVEVIRGSVRVLDGDGNVLAAAVTAGTTWRVPEPARAAAERKPDRPAAERIDVATALARARALLAAGDTGSARRVAGEVLARRPRATHAAEARTVVAECALVDGDRRHAIRAYLEVADRYPRLLAGESALYAAARVATEAGDVRARRLLSRYLERYPQGRFRPEVAKHLAALAGR